MENEKNGTRKTLSAHSTEHPTPEPDVQVVKDAVQPAHGKDRIRVRGSGHRSAKKNGTKGKTRGAGIHAE